MKKKKSFGKILLGIFTVILVVLLVAVPFLLQSAQRLLPDRTSILNAQAKYMSIDKTVSGAGTLTDQEAIEVKLPYGVEVTEYLVGNDDFVTEGTPLVRVDRIGIMNAIYKYQDDMQYIEKQMAQYTDTGAMNFLTTASAGRVMVLYGKEGDSINDVMLEHGALAVLSLDGLLAVDIDIPDGITVGSSLGMVTESGEIVPCRVESKKNGVAVVTVDQEGRSVGENVRVIDLNSDEVGSGTLYVHSALNISGYSGTIEAVHVQINQDVFAGATIFTYSGNSNSAEYEVFASRHRDLEELTEQLFKMNTDGTINAPCDGVITGIDEDAAAELLAAEDNDAELVFLKNSSEADAPIFTRLSDIEPPDITYPYFFYEAGIISDYSVKDERFDIIRTDNRYLSAEEAAREIMSSNHPDSMTRAEMLSYGSQFDVLTRQTFSSIVIFQYECTSESSYSLKSVSLSNTSVNPDTSASRSMGGSGSMGGSMQVTPETHEYYSTKTTSIMSVIPQETMTVDITVDELDILSIEKGQAVLITIDAMPGQSFEAVVNDIGVTGSANEGGNSKFTAQVTLERKPNMIGGMNVTALITLESSGDVLTVPAEAIFEEGSRKYICTGYDEKTKSFTGEIDVETGLSDGINVEIRSGINEGDTVFYPYYDTPSVSFDPMQFAPIG